MNKSALIGVVVTLLSLVSCGGNSNQIPSNIVLPGSTQSYLNAPTYAAGTEELAAFQAINQFRFSVGLGYWEQNILLDHAAANHMYYSVSNQALVANPFQTDLEAQTINGTPTAGFTGITPSARGIAVGYYVLENIITAQNVPTAVVGELYSTGSGVNAVNDMINTIYHRSGLMAQSTRQIGIARDTAGVATADTHWWFNHGRLDAGQSMSSDYISQYPLNQQLGVPLSMTPEFPSVYSNQTNFNFATMTSSPVSLTTAAIVNLSPQSFTVTPANSSTPLSGTIWTMSNDPNLNTNSNTTSINGLINPPPPAPTIPANEVFWVGKAPFLPNTTYNVTFTGTTYLVPYGITNPITSTWSFTTGS